MGCRFSSIFIVFLGLTIILDRNFMRVCWMRVIFRAGEFALDDNVADTDDHQNDNYPNDEH
jgi:hypothetical protein